jgi:hypothetical protein
MRIIAEDDRDVVAPPQPHRSIESRKAIGCLLEFSEAHSPAILEPQGEPVWRALGPAPQSVVHDPRRFGHVGSLPHPPAD